MLRYTVVGDPGPYDEVTFDHQGLPAGGVTANVVAGVGAALAAVNVTATATRTTTSFRSPDCLFISGLLSLEEGWLKGTCLRFLATTRPGPVIRWLLSIIYVADEVNSRRRWRDKRKSTEDGRFATINPFPRR